MSQQTPPHSTRVSPARAGGTVTVPSSKSHSIRALLIAACADGVSRIENVLASADAESCMNALRTLGVDVRVEARSATGLTVVVTPPAGGMLAGAGADAGAATRSAADADANTPNTPPVIDVGNSGTTLYLLSGLAALRPGGVSFDGDASIRRRSAAQLLSALQELGAAVDAGPVARCDGCAPYTVRGPLVAGRTVAVESPTSQYLSALLLAAPLIAATSAVGAAGDGDSSGADAAVHLPATTFDIRLLNEHPYVDMTCWWLDRQGISYSREGYRQFRVPAGQRYRPVQRALPGDYSSATFWFAAAAVTGGAVTVRGLAPDDVQGDREVLTILHELGCTVEWADGEVGVSGKPVRGGSFDLNAMPDALPALAVVGCAAPEQVELRNVPQARQKETDRIAVMTSELRRLGATVEELPDGLIVHPSPLAGGTVDSHGDHRVAMAMAIAALGATGPVTIDDAGAAAVTYPSFFADLQRVAPGSVP